MTDLHHGEDDHPRKQLKGLPEGMQASDGFRGLPQSRSEHALAKGTNKAQVQDLRRENHLHTRSAKLRIKGRHSFQIAFLHTQYRQTLGRTATSDRNVCIFPAPTQVHTTGQWWSNCMTHLHVQLSHEVNIEKYHTAKHNTKPRHITFMFQD